MYANNVLITHFNTKKTDTKRGLEFERFFISYPRVNISFTLDRTIKKGQFFNFSVLGTAKRKGKKKKKEKKIALARSARASLGEDAPDEK
jgi:hypothetical protein